MNEKMKLKLPGFVVAMGGAFALVYYWLVIANPTWEAALPVASAACILFGYRMMERVDKYYHEKEKRKILETGEMP